MPGEYAPINVRETRLWKRLSQPFADPTSNELSVTLAQVLPDICRIASDRMKLMPAFHPEFTLHDNTHLLRVTELMARVMPDCVLEKVLNPVEIALLILAAHFHDVGMIVDAQEASQIRQSERYIIARQNWLIGQAAVGPPQCGPVSRYRPQ
jgi:response regulator RpfG family c-di-GMP phosphodiesterase